MTKLSITACALFLVVAFVPLVSSLSLGNGNEIDRSMVGQSQLSRKTFLTRSIAAVSVSVSTLPLLVPQRAFGADGENDPNKFTRIKASQFAYSLTLPVEPNPTNKPLQTHLDEVNLPTSLKGYSYAITVDPIRLNSLKEFGTPNEVAAKIVMAELRRDGVLDVTMGRDPTEDSSTGGYDVEYISDGKRGKKHFVTRTIVQGGKLYVLTVQCKEDDFSSVEKEVFQAVNTFRVLEQ